MKLGMKIVARVILLSMAAAVFIALGGMWAGSIRSSEPDFREERGGDRIVRRKLEPQLYRTPSFLADIVIISLIAVGARVILRVRLTHRN